MTSQALGKWRSDRSTRLDKLFAAHARISDGARGRWETDELNHAIILRLAAEFQGFCRDLHDECGDAVVAALELKNPSLAIILGRYNLQYARKIDSGNAQPASLGTDFGRFNLPLWAELKARYPSRARTWNEKLTLLNEARNGIAHDDNAKLDRLRAAGWSLTVATARRWRSGLDGLAMGMDTVCEVHLRGLLGRAPW